MVRAPIPSGTSRTRTMLARQKLPRLLSEVESFPGMYRFTFGQSPLEEHSMRYYRKNRSLSTSTRLSLEPLEDRAVPATVVFSNGNLSVSNPQNLVGGHTNLQVLQNADGTFTVKDNTSTVGTYHVTGNITISGSNLADLITVTLNDSSGNGFLPGSLTIFGNNGNDSINVTGTVGTETIRGNLSVDGGFGNDSMNLGVGTGNGLTVRGNAQFVGNLGNDSVAVGNTGNTTTVRGALLVYSTQVETLTNTTVLGSALDDLLLSPSSFSSEFSTLSFSMDGNSSIAGQLTINGGPISNTFTLPNGATLGTTVINGTGNDTLDLGATVNGSFTFNSGDGTDSIRIRNSATITNDLNLNVGNGAITYKLGSFTVGGNVNLTSGSGNQSITGADSFVATVGGTLTISWGSGTNVFTLGAAGSVAKIVENLTNGGINTLNIKNNTTSTNTITVNVPAATGTYNITVDFAAGGTQAQSVTFLGGIGGATPSVTNATINRHGNGALISVNSAGLAGTKNITIN
jgi:hypothetical protein